MAARPGLRRAARPRRGLGRGLARRLRGRIAIETARQPTIRRSGAWRRGRWAVLAVALLGAAVGGWWRLAGTNAAEPVRPAPPGEGVPVTTVPATLRNVPVYLTGIGNVQALYSVLVRARVDGTLDSVAFTEGQEVKKGDLLAVIDPRPYQATLDQAAAQKAKDEAALANAKLDLERYSRLARSQFAPQQQVDTQQAMVDQLAAAIKADEANMESAGLNLSFTHVVSPINGRVGLRLVDPGNLIHANDTGGLVTVTQVHPITIVFTLPEEDLPRLIDAQRAGPLKVLAYSSDHKTRLSEGKLLTPDNAIDMTSGTIKLKAEFQNADNRLWPGQFVDARVQVAVLPDAVTVPAASVQRGQDGMYVYVVKPDSTVAMRPVEEVLEQDDLAVIARGVEAGNQVVTNGQSRLTDGARVAARPPAQPAKPMAAGERSG
jgi:multidrug efflux system membrane fusion protein